PRTTGCGTPPTADCGRTSTRSRCAVPNEEKVRVRVGDRRLVVSNLSKVLYPEHGFTKAQVIEYYLKIAPVLLPHIADRPLTLKRYPDGVDGEFFRSEEHTSELQS